MDFPLYLKYCGRQQHHVAGVLISGNGAADWLAHCTSWRGPVSAMRFLPVTETRSSSDRSSSSKQTIGALCITTSGQLPEAAVTDSATLPYWCRAGRVWLPVDADLMPDISDAELQRLLPSDRCYVWHPAIGLVGYESEHLLSVTDLVTPPRAVDVDWEDADIGPHLNDTLHQLLPEPNSSLDDLLSTGQDDIGSESDHLENAPRSPDESSAGLRDAAAAVFSGLNAVVARGIHGLTSRLPSGEHGSKVLGRLHDWAESVLSGMAGGGGSGQQRDPGLTRKRENELKRLMSLLDSDPDQGLKYALPLNGGQDRGRGRSDASSRLGRHNSEFHLNGLNRSGRADVWNVSWEYHVRLQARYRELALREQRLGRHRRAAYIYAQLLNDLPSAAAALHSGRLYRDAAVVYLEHLNQPIKAAECLSQGGFWEEAVQIYRNRERWLDAGELYQRIGLIDDARTMFANEIKDCERRSDFVSAADVANVRLNDPDQAAELLVTGWRQSSNGQTCLRNLMTLHASCGRHRHARVALQQLTIEDELQVEQLQAAVQVCSDSASDYPDEGVRQEARLHTLRLAASLLQCPDQMTGVSQIRATALEAVRSLAKSDRLLQTDTQRYELQQQLTLPTVIRSRQSGPLRQVRQITTAGLLLNTVPEGTRWMDIVSSGSCVYRCGLTIDDRLVLVRQLLAVRRDGRITSNDSVIVLADPVEPDSAPFRLHVQPGLSSVLLVSAPGATPCRLTVRNIQRILESDFVDMIMVNLQNVLCVVPGIFCLSLVAGSTEAQLEINVLSRPDRRDRTIALDSVWETIVSVDDDPTFCALHVGDQIYVTLDRSLLHIASLNSRATRTTQDVDTLRLIQQFAKTPTRLTASATGSNTKLVYSFPEGVQVVWPEQRRSCELASDFVNPITAFSGNGILAVACSATDRLEFYRLNDAKAELIARALSSDTRPARQIQFLTCGLSGNQILAFSANGQVDQFEIAVR
ncbi:MAG: hypothetical protein R3C59_12540 [Planctomycetaceae bacterium]